MNLEYKHEADEDVERRVGGPVDKIDEAVVIAMVEGVGPASDHMSDAGVNRDTALRALSIQKYRRPVKEETLLKVVRTLGAKLLSKK